MTEATPPAAAPSGSNASAKEAVPDPIANLQERLGPQIEQAAEQLKELNVRVKDFIKQNPGTTLLGAAALGFIIGKLASRR